MNVYLTVEEIYQLRELIYEEMDRLGGIERLSPELLKVSRKLLK